MMANHNLHKELPFSNLTDYALVTLLASSKQRILEMLSDMELINILKSKFNPTQVETLEDSNCRYYDVDEYNQMTITNRPGLTIFHQNIHIIFHEIGTK